MWLGDVKNKPFCSMKEYISVKRRTAFLEGIPVVFLAKTVKKRRKNGFLRQKTIIFSYWMLLYQP